MRYLTTIFGEETLQSILSTLPNTYGPNVSTYFRIESQKSWKMRFWAYFGTFLLAQWIFTYFKRILTLIKEDAQMGQGIVCSHRIMEQRRETIQNTFSRPLPGNIISQRFFICELKPDLLQCHLIHHHIAAQFCVTIKYLIMGSPFV